MTRGGLDVPETYVTPIGRSSLGSHRRLQWIRCPKECLVAEEPAPKLGGAG
jgi:hypothetical protein